MVIPRSQVDPSYYHVVELSEHREGKLEWQVEQTRRTEIDEPLCTAI